ncbi:hypothetical protein WMY93_033903 [Mugilogobius chulae]|uniref:Uncharacterized protein n=1 Tax=Mugilogobius chulae TaxID=88201 RepID=A0AAW0MLY0_9GOBI
MTTTQLTTLLLVLLSSLSACAFPSSPRDKQQQHASWDEVNVVAHGLLQLGQALKEHVDKTKAQVRELNGGLREASAGLQRLEQEREEREEREEKEREELRMRLEKLEQKVEDLLRTPASDTNSSDDAEVPFVQRLMAAQNRRMDLLVEKMKQQQEKLEKQSVHLQTLQSKVGQKRMKSFRRKQDVTMERDETTQNGETLLITLYQNRLRLRPNLELKMVRKEMKIKSKQW